MENQNNNKNGLLGLAILIGIALLVAVFCSPLVAHAETTNDFMRTYPKGGARIVQGVCVSDYDDNKIYHFGFAPTSFSTMSDYYKISNLGEDYVYLIPFYMKRSDEYAFAIVSRTPFDITSTTYFSSGSTCNENHPWTTETFGYGGVSVYGHIFSKPSGTRPNWYITVDCDNSTESIAKFLVSSMYGGDFELTGSVVYDPNEKGSEDNPEYDEEIGTLQLKNVAFVKSNFLNLPSWLEGAVIPQVMANFFSGDYLVEWKNTTSTGLSLNYYEEKYGKLQYEYFLECRCSYLNIGGSVGDQFPSYGNRSPIRYEQGSVKHLSLKASDILDSIDGVKEDWTKCLLNKEAFQLKFRLYIRPKFTQSLTVIPDSSSNAKWVCGRWCAVDLKFRDIVLGNDSHAETGEFNENDVWVTDDDTGFDINSGMINADSVDDALDKLHSYEDIDISDYIKNLNAFSEEVKSIPIIIAKLLSFLPSWVPILIGILIGTCCFVGILRILRG